MQHGGQFHVYYSRTNTTHIIANNLPNSKIQELKGQKVIRPEWITDRCVQLNISLISQCKISESSEFLLLFCCFGQCQGWASLALPTVPALCQTQRPTLSWRDPAENLRCVWNRPSTASTKHPSKASSATAQQPGAVSIHLPEQAHPSTQPQSTLHSRRSIHTHQCRSKAENSLRSITQTSTV